MIQPYLAQTTSTSLRGSTGWCSAWSTFVPSSSWRWPLALFAFLPHQIWECLLIAWSGAHLHLGHSSLWLSDPVERRWIYQVNWMTCVNSRPNTAQADFSSRKWWLPLASQSQRRRRAPLHGSLLVGSFHQSSSVTNTGKNTFPGSVIIIIIIITIILCVMNQFVLGAHGFHPAHSGLQHWTDLQPLVPPCHRYNPLDHLWTCNAVNLPGSDGDMLNYASSYILALIMVNLFIYCMFYLAMKLVSGERPTCWVKWPERFYHALPKQAWTHFVLWVVFNCVAISFFSPKEKTTDLSPATSRFSPW